MALVHLFAIWETDSTQHFYGGEVTAMDAEGRVAVKGYGENAWITPLKLLPLEKGVAFYEELNVIYWKMRDEQDRVRREYNQEVIELLESKKVLDKQERKGLYYSWVRELEGTKRERRSK